MSFIVISVISLAVIWYYHTAHSDHSLILILLAAIMELYKLLALGLAFSLVGIALGNPTRNSEKLELPSSSISPQKLTPDPDANEVRWGVINPRFSRLWAPWTYAGPAGYPGKVNNWGRR